LKKKILLIGGGGHCRACIDVIEQENVFEIAGIIDKKEKIGDEIFGYKIIDCDDNLSKYTGFSYALITAGFVNSDQVRVKLYIMVSQIFSMPKIISPNAFVSRHTDILKGTIVMHHAMINANAVIGENCIINSKALIEHDATIADNCHISTGAIINGGCKIGERVFIGSNSVVKQGIIITDDVIVGMGSVVTKDITESGVYWGNPARKYK